MHFFALFLMFAFGVMGATALGDRLYRRLHEGRAVVPVAWGIGLAWLADLNMWTGWSIGNLRYAWVGVTLTGVALAGTALALHAITGFFAGMHRKLDDQADQLERTGTELRRVA